MYYTLNVVPVYARLPDMYVLCLESIIIPAKTSLICSMDSCPRLAAACSLHGKEVGLGLTL
jgi:hypothetical protein